MKTLIKKSTGDWIHFVDDKVVISDFPYGLPDEFIGTSILNNYPDVELITIYVIKESEIPSDSYLNSIAIEYTRMAKSKKEILGFKIGTNFILKLFFNK